MGVVDQRMEEEQSEEENGGIIKLDVSHGGKKGARCARWQRQMRRARGIQLPFVHPGTIPGLLQTA